MLKKLWNYTDDAQNPYCEYPFYTTDNDSFIIDWSNDKTVFCFAGSNDIKDWFDNFHFAQSDINHKDIHDGFEQAFMSIFKEYQKYFTRAIQRGLPIYLIGHSKGGALAIIGTYYMLTSYNFDKTLLNAITFGTPMVGGEKFCNFMQRSEAYILEVINLQDVITKCPPEVFGYMHCGLVKLVKPKWYHSFMKIKAHLEYGKVIK